MNYSDPMKLGKLLDDSEDTLKWVAQKYPSEIRKYLALRARMGKSCPMARGVLKLLCYYEAKNDKFVKSIETGTWDI